MSVVEAIPGENVLANNREHESFAVSNEAAIEFDSIEDLYGLVKIRSTREDGRIDPNSVLSSVFQTVRDVDLSSVEVNSAFVASSILGMFKQEGVIRGEASVQRYYDYKNDKEFSYARYVAFNGRNVVLDIDNNFFSSIPDNDIHPALWRYLDIEHKRRLVGEQTRRVLDGEAVIERLDERGRQNISFVLSVIVDKV